ncbi:MAG: amidohydrolase [Planctomycetales bacterium]
MQPERILQDARGIADWIVKLRRELHQHPELAYQEVRPSALGRRTRDELGIAYRHPIALTGVVATLGNGQGPCVALRADMDALPIHEESDVDFRSQVDGKMHACGHDCHTAMLLGAARLLKQLEPELHGTVKLLFQPAEEGGAGGERMCDEGALADPPVARVFGLHVFPTIATGHVGSRAGTFLAATGALDIAIIGRGGHAAFPHQTIDPVVTAAKLICELQTIVSRELDPLESGVVSITTIHAGEAFNVIPPQVRMTGTIRSLTLPGLHFLQERIREIAQHVCLANRCQAEVLFPGHDLPATVNDAHCWEVARGLAAELIDGQNVHEIPPVMGGEDFAYYAQKVPGCFVGLGIGNEQVGSTYGLHHPKFKVDEAALPLGSSLHVAFALRSLQELRVGT